MKSKVTKNHYSNRNYPYIGKFESDIAEYYVLFSKRSSGTIIHVERCCKDSSLRVGDYYNQLVEYDFEVCREEITLSND